MSWRAVRGGWTTANTRRCSHTAQLASAKPPLDRRSARWLSARASLERPMPRAGDGIRFQVIVSACIVTLMSRRARPRPRRIAHPRTKRMIGGWETVDWGLAGRCSGSGGIMARSSHRRTFSWRLVRRRHASRPSSAAAETLQARHRRVKNESRMAVAQVRALEVIARPIGPPGSDRDDVGRGRAIGGRCAVRVRRRARDSTPIPAREAGKWPSMMQSETVDAPVRGAIAPQSRVPPAAGTERANDGRVDAHHPARAGWSGTWSWIVVLR
jgi:hypothetical protein